MELLRKALESGSRKDLLDAVGCNHGMLSKWLNGLQKPGTKYILPLADFLGVTPEELLKDIHPEQKEE